MIFASSAQLKSEIGDTWAQFMQAGAAICPQGAVALHAVTQAVDKNIIKKDDTVVSISTASAMKFTDAGIAYHKSDAKFSNPYIVVDEQLSNLEASL